MPRVLKEENLRLRSLLDEAAMSNKGLARRDYLTQVTCRLRLIESREVEEIRDLLELRQGKGARWFEQI